MIGGVVTEERLPGDGAPPSPEEGGQGVRFIWSAVSVGSSASASSTADADVGTSSKRNKDRMRGRTSGQVDRNSTAARSRRTRPVRAQVQRLSIRQRERPVPSQNSVTTCSPRRTGARGRPCARRASRTEQSGRGSGPAGQGTCIASESDPASASTQRARSGARRADKHGVRGADGGGQGAARRDGTADPVRDPVWRACLRVWSRAERARRTPRSARPARDASARPAALRAYPQTLASLRGDELSDGWPRRPGPKRPPLDGGQRVHVDPPGEHDRVRGDGRREASTQPRRARRLGRRPDALGG